MYIHTALYAEAKPIIEFFDLKRVDDNFFKIYAKDNKVLIVSGIGKINTALALSHLFTKYQTSKSDLEHIVNIGIAGGDKSLSIGDMVNVNKILDIDTDSVYHLKKLTFIKNLSCSTSSKPQFFSKAKLADMEASAVYVSAKRYKVEPLILKVISDYFEPKNVDKNEISNLILKNINKISELLTYC